MPKIKTRDVVKGTIKKIDKAAIAADRMRSAYVQTKEKAEHATHPEEHSAEEYASGRIEGGVDRMTHEAAHQFDKQGRKGLAETNISAERYARMSINYENEQRELVKRVDEDEKRLVSIEQTSLDLKTLLKVLRSSTAFEELTPTLVNSLIRRIEVHNNDKSSGHCSVKVDIYFTAIGLIDIPTEDEIKILMEKIQSNPQEYRLTA